LKVCALPNSFEAQQQLISLFLAITKLPTTVVRNLWGYWGTGEGMISLDITERMASSLDFT
jgi:hypothetical protein